MRKRTRARQRGNAMIEFALAFTVLFPTLTGVYQFGQAYYQYNNLETAVRAGARYASLRVYDSANSSPTSAYRDAVRNVVLTGDPNSSNDSKQAIVPLQPSNVEVLMTFQNGVPAFVTVQVVSYDLDAMFTKFRLNAKPKVVFPYIGRWDPVP
jgi:Flp pilus assembly protein TadG